jgi:hypothetical protein
MKTHRICVISYYNIRGRVLVVDDNKGLIEVIELSLLAN